MLRNKKQLLTIPFFAVIASALSVIYQTRISSEGFFSFYQGPTYTGKGWPWMFFKIFEDDKIALDHRMLALTIVFWLIVGTILILIIKSLIYLLSRPKNRKIT